MWPPLANSGIWLSLSSAALSEVAWLPGTAECFADQRIGGTRKDALSRPEKSVPINPGEAHTAGGPNPRLTQNLPGWLLRELGGG
jgi:hypothetical protein